MVDGAYASHDFEGLHDTEADLTVNREAGTVYGRVVDSDGEVYLVRSDQEGKHYWIEVCAMYWVVCTFKKKDN